MCVSSYINIVLFLESIMENFCHLIRQFYVKKIVQTKYLEFNWHNRKEQCLNWNFRPYINLAQLPHPTQHRHCDQSRTSYNNWYEQYMWNLILPISHVDLSSITSIIGKRCKTSVITISAFLRHELVNMLTASMEIPESHNVIDASAKYCPLLLVCVASTSFKEFFSPE